LQAAAESVEEYGQNNASPHAKEARAIKDQLQKAALEAEKRGKDLIKQIDAWWNQIVGWLN